ncbi:MAG: Mur ligase family protein [Sphaerochaetaceae bacterium]
MKRLSALCENNKLKAECGFRGGNDPWIASLGYDSRTIRPDSVYFAFTGLHDDGHAFIEDALGKGAVAVVHSQELDLYHEDVVYIRTANPHRLFSSFASVLWDHVERRLSIIGVTGTDGKTTTCDFLWQLLNKNGVRCALLDTVDMDDGSGKHPSPYRQSTPEVTEIYPFLQRCHANHMVAVVLEATSHGLSEKFARLADIPFSGAIYTTLTSEHLEFHGNIENYVEAKLNLARQLLPGAPLVMPEDFPYASQVRHAAPEHSPILTYSLDKTDSQAEVQVHSSSFSCERRYFTCCTAGHLVAASIPFGAAFLLRNALGSTLMASRMCGTPPEKLLYQLAWLERVDGRFEVIATGLPFMVVIDFAHTADAFQTLFTQMRQLRPQGRLVALFGAAGERDHSKRAPMGRIAGTYCDAVFLTDEDPRRETSQAIFQEIQAGIPPQSPCEVFTIADRSQAIAQALRYCQDGDTLLLLGKGHEQSIQYTGCKMPWNEKAVLRQQVASFIQDKEEHNG